MSREGFDLEVKCLGSIFCLANAFSRKLSTIDLKFEI